MAMFTVLAFHLILAVHATQFESKFSEEKQYFPKERNSPSDANRSIHSLQHIWSMLCSTYGGQGQTVPTTNAADPQLGPAKQTVSQSLVNTHPLYSYMFAKRSQNQNQHRVEPAEPNGQRPRQRRNTLANYPWDLSK